MNYELIALIGLVVLTAVISNRYQSRTWSGRPGYQYQRVITVGVLGLCLTVTGAIGLDLRHAHGWFRGIQWVDGPVGWQLGLGVILLATAVLLARRVPPDATRSQLIR